MFAISEKDIYGDRLKKARLKLGLTQEEFAGDLKLAWFQIKDMESGRKRLTPQLLELLEHKYAINVRWLISGEEPMFLSAEHDYSNYQEGRHALEGSEKGDGIVVHLSTITVCCGHGIMTYPTEFLDETVMVNRKQVGRIDNDRYPYAVQTQGRSMVGFGVEEESIVIINPGEEICSGHIVLVTIDDKASIKKLYEHGDGIDLVAANGEKLRLTHEELNDTDYIRILGRVMLVISPPNEGV